MLCFFLAGRKTHFFHAQGLSLVYRILFILCVAKWVALESHVQVSSKDYKLWVRQYYMVYELVGDAVERTHNGIYIVQRTYANWECLCKVVCIMSDATLECEKAGDKPSERIRIISRLRGRTCSFSSSNTQGTSCVQLNCNQNIPFNAEGL